MGTINIHIICILELLLHIGGMFYPSYQSKKDTT